MFSYPSEDVRRLLPFTVKYDLETLVFYSVNHSLCEKLYLSAKDLIRSHLTLRRWLLLSNPQTETGNALRASKLCSFFYRYDAAGHFRVYIRNIVYIGWPPVAMAKFRITP